jgi:hypothetical protein
MPTYYTDSFTPRNPVEGIAFCQAEGKEEARLILVEEIEAKGLKMDSFLAIHELLSGAIVVTGDY